MLVEAVVLIAIGFVLLFIEIFLLPSFGPVGVLGGILIISGLVLAGYKEGFYSAIKHVGITFGFMLPVCAIAYWLLPKTKLGRAFILDTSERKEVGFQSGPELEHLVGKVGMAVTHLRPAGTAEFDGERLHVISEGEFIQKGERIQVIRVEGNKIVVSQKKD